MAPITAAVPERTRLEALLGFHILDTPPEPAFDDLTGLAALIAETPMALISFVDRERLWFKSRIGVPQSEVPRAGSFCEESIRNPPLFEVPDACEDERFRENPMVKAGVRFYAGATLVVAQRHAIGNLSVLDTRPRRLSRTQQDSLVVLARAVTAQLELRREVRARQRQDRIMLSLLGDLKDGAQKLREANAGLERRVSERTAQIEVAIKELEGFCSNVAHNLRAPLRTINGFSQALLREHARGLDAAGRGCLGRIVHGSRRLDRMISDLLAYYRLPHAEVPVEPVELSAVLDRVVAALKREILERRARLELERSLPRVRADAGLLGQALAQLLSNALKFTAPGVRPSVRVTAERRGARVRLWVEDNGIGIAPRHQELIFLVFEQLNKTEDYPGTGIGLAIARKATERMGGRLGVESRAGGGSRFWLELSGAD